MMSMKQVGVLGIYIMLAYILDNKRSPQLRRIGEICLGMYLMSTVFALNNVTQYKSAFVGHVLGGDYMRYMVVITLAGCALSFFSGYFLRDMSICAAVTLLLVTGFVDARFGYWVGLRVHLWNQIRQVMNNGCAVVGLLFIFCNVDNRLKADWFSFAGDCVLGCCCSFCNFKTGFTLLAFPLSTHVF